jgi:hypothetical protein
MEVGLGSRSFLRVEVAEHAGRARGRAHYWFRVAASTSDHAASHHGLTCSVGVYLVPIFLFRVVQEKVTRGRISVHRLLALSVLMLHYLSLALS